MQVYSLKPFFISQWFPCSTFSFFIPSFASLFFYPRLAQAGIQDTTTFDSMVPFACSFSGGSDLISMDYMRDGTTGYMYGNSESLQILSNQVPRVNITLNTLLAPSGISFRGIWIRSDSTNRYIKPKHQVHISNSAISTTLQSSEFRSNGYSSGLPYGVRLAVSTRLSNSFPNEEYCFHSVLTCLEP